MRFGVGLITHICLGQWLSSARLWMRSHCFDTFYKSASEFVDFTDGFHLWASRSFIMPDAADPSAAGMQPPWISGKMSLSRIKFSCFVYARGCFSTGVIDFCGHLVRSKSARPRQVSEFFSITRSLSFLWDGSRLCALTHHRQQAPTCCVEMLRFIWP